MADEGLHEIQLNGKQLVFLFMASTVVAVVIFLCGVMVGRGVRAQRPAEAVEASVDAATDPTASTPALREPAPSSASIPSNAPVAANETLTYPSRLEGQEPVEETLKPGLGARDSGLGARDSGLVAKAASPKPEPATTNDRRGGPSAAAKASADKSGPAEPAAAAEPAGNGFVVQVAAVNSRSEADAIATRLAGKGYPSFVTMPPGGVKMFRVRIGKYPTRREAETIAARLEKEDQFKPWITR
jgi:cell division septation protein DedD